MNRWLPSVLLPFLIASPSAFADKSGVGADAGRGPSGLSAHFVDRTVVTDRPQRVEPVAAPRRRPAEPDRPNPASAASPGPGPVAAPVAVVCIFNTAQLACNPAPGPLNTPPPAAPPAAPPAGAPVPDEIPIPFLADQGMRDITLDPPTPRIDPGEGLCGLRMYLQTGAELDYTITVPVPGRTRTVQFTFHLHTTALHIDWGNSEWPSTIDNPTNPGAPYPKGDITHVYENAGTYNITVTQTMTATWEAEGQTGTITQPRTVTGTLSDFRIRQLQAVRINKPDQ